MQSPAKLCRFKEDGGRNRVPLNPGQSGESPKLSRRRTDQALRCESVTLPGFRVGRFSGEMQRLAGVEMEAIVEKGTTSWPSQESLGKLKDGVRTKWHWLEASSVQGVRSL